MTKTLALFDFDGTLTTKDSLVGFILHTKGLPKTLFGAFWLSPILVAYIFKLIPNDEAKQRVLRYFFSGTELAEAEEKGFTYARHKIPNILRPQGLARLQWHIKQGHRVVIVSASASLWLKNWTDTLNVELLSTQLEVVDNQLTGKFSGNNCHGEEKVKRIKEHLNLDEYKCIYAYGDTLGDMPMLALANHPEYKPFR